MPDSFQYSIGFYGYIKVKFGIFSLALNLYHVMLNIYKFRTKYCPQLHQVYINHCCQHRAQIKEQRGYKIRMNKGELNWKFLKFWVKQLENFLQALKMHGPTILQAFFRTFVYGPVGVGPMSKIGYLNIEQVPTAPQTKIQNVLRK